MKRTRIPAVPMQIFFIVLLLIALCVCMAQLLTQGTLARNVTQRTLGELQIASRRQALEIQHDLALQFAALDTLAAYLGTLDSEELTGQEDLMRAFLPSGRDCALGYADIDGSIRFAVSANRNAPDGNIAKRAYFRSAMARRNSHAVEYLPPDQTGMTYAVLAVPVAHKNMIRGVLLLRMEQDAFEDLLWPDDEGRAAELMLMDSSGSILARSAGAGGGSLPELFANDPACARLQSDLAAVKSVTLALTDQSGQVQFLSCAPVGVNDWFAVCTMDSDTAAALYTAELQPFTTSVNNLCLLFAGCAALLFVLFVLFENRSRRRTAQLQDFSLKVHDFMEQSGNLLFDFDVHTLQLAASPPLLAYLGEELPENWFSRLAKRRRLHPEFDYKSLMEAYHRLLLTGNYQQLDMDLRLKDRGLRRVRISMTATRDNADQIRGIFGILTDITDANDPLPAGQSSPTQALLRSIPVAVSVDLSANTYTFLHPPAARAELFSRQGAYDDLLLRLADAVPDSYRGLFLDTFSRQALLAASQAAQAGPELEHPVQFTPEDPQLWVLSRVTILPETPGENARILFVSLDLSRQREDVLQLQRSYELVIENMPGYVCKWQFTENDILLLEANSAFYRFMKATPDQLRGRSVLEGCAREEQARTLALLQAQAQKHRDIRYSGQSVKPDGTAFWMNVNGSYFSQQDGCAVYYCVIWDMTPAVHLQEQSRMDAREWQLAAAMSACPILRYDVERRRIHLLSRAEGDESIALLDGHAPEYAMESGLIPASCGTAFQAVFHAIEQGQQAGSFRFAAGKDEGLQWFTGQYRTLFHQTGEPVSAILLLHRDAAVPAPASAWSAASRTVTIRTFGYFDVFVDGRPISFPHNKSKEMLAVLVDRRGGFVSTAEMIGYLWEDEPATRAAQNRCRQVASRLKRILEENGVSDIIETVNGSRRIIPEKVNCDYFNYLADKIACRHLFNGSYMLNYSWGEVTLADLENGQAQL